MRFRPESQGRHGLQGRTVFLVDDILTTGRTTGAAARTLKQAGAARVVGGRRPGRGEDVIV